MTGFKGKTIISYTAKVCLWLSGEKQMTSHIFVIVDHEQNILGYNILKGKVWQLPNGDVWSFGTHKTPTQQKPQTQ